MVAAVVAGIICLAALPANAAAHSVTVDPKLKFTPTGVTVSKGDTITVTASGHVHFGGNQINSVDPNGVEWGPKCQAINQRKKLVFPAQGLACWSLIGRIRHSTKFVEIGTKKTFTADRDGELVLGVNDNFRNDNSGTWTAQITVTPAGTAPPPSKSSSNGAPVLFAIFGGLIAAALLLFFLLRRRRKTEEPGEPGKQAAPEPALVGPAAAAAAGAAAASAPHYEPEPETPPAPVIPTAPPDPESIDVNIFEVEFTNGLQMTVGYNHFPDGTLLNWKVTQSRKPVAVGSFIAQGGGSTNHYETVPLGLKLEGRDSEPDGADVQFDWSINGVPFRYSVRRDPNC